MRASLLALTLVLSAVTAGAQATPALEFAKGPGQWLLTAEERNAFKRAKTEEAAQALVDLFWARRDPTPGNFVNELRAEFAERVSFADRNFKEGNKRGSLTERGRVLVMLGFPADLNAEDSKRSSQYSDGAGGAMDPTGGRALAGREVWNYKYEQASKYGMPKIEVVFIHDGLRGHVRRDTQRNDFISAIPAAVKYYITGPTLTEVPDWAKNEIERVELQPTVDRPATVEVATPSAESPAPKVESRTPKVEVRPASVGKLTLVADAFAIEPESGADPFASLAPRSEFRRDSELGWVAEYCTGSLDRTLSSVEVTLKITGLIKGERVNFNAPPEDLVPDSIKASPGCYLVRGGVPLMEMDPASYTLFVKVGSYNLTKDFRVIE